MFLKNQITDFYQRYLYELMEVKNNICIIQCAI
jgi:hypothetical protein